MDLIFYSFVTVLLSWTICSAQQATRLICQQLSTLECGAQGRLHFHSTNCPSYRHAMQLLQENCSDRSVCAEWVIRHLRGKCCSDHRENPQIVYACSTGVYVPALPMPGRGYSTLPPVKGGHSFDEQIIVAVIASIFVLLWGIGLLFFYIRYRVLKSGKNARTSKENQVPGAVHSVTLQNCHGPYIHGIVHDTRYPYVQQIPCAPPPPYEYAEHV